MLSFDPSAQLSARATRVRTYALREGRWKLALEAQLLRKQRVEDRRCGEDRQTRCGGLVHDLVSCISVRCVHEGVREAEKVRDLRVRHLFPEGHAIGYAELPREFLEPRTVCTILIREHRPMQRYRRLRQFP